MKIEDYHKDLLSDVGSSAEALNNVSEHSFKEICLGELVDIAVIDDFEITDYYNKNKGFKVDAWYYDQTSNLLNLIVSDFSNKPEIETINESSLKKAIDRPINFFKTCTKDQNFKRSLEDSDPISALAWKIHDLENRDISLKIILISNKLISKRTKNIKLEEKLKLDVWDLNRFYDLAVSGQSKEPIEINLKGYSKDDVMVLRANNKKESLESFLFVLNGEVLASIYDDWGERLLESNVRTFLQNRGKVNNGMRKTIASQPERFFCYNNGITATAESVNIDSSGNLTNIKNFQIVNGGQTTASIFSSRLKDKVPLEDVFVQVKMTVIPDALTEDLVPKISEYSNTQNKVSVTDFASNKAWNIKIEEISRRLLAPPSQDGALFDTHWFYERTRGQFANAQLKLSQSQAKAFIKKNPKQQKIDKTYLSRVSNTFDMVPHKVSKGAQESFRHFVDKINTTWDKNPASVNDLYFQSKISQIIIFKHTDKLILKNLGGAYKANILTYTIAKLTYEAAEIDLTWPLQKIWENQTVPEKLSKQLNIYVSKTKECLEQTGLDLNKNISQWAKQLGCWEKIKEMDFGIGNNFYDLLISNKEVKRVEKNAKRDQTELNKVNNVAYILEKGPAHWAELIEWNTRAKKLAAFEISIANYAVANRVLSDAQAKKLVAAEKRCEDKGFPDIIE